MHINNIKKYKDTAAFIYIWNLLYNNEIICFMIKSRLELFCISVEKCSTNRNHKNMISDAKN
jgi:hypothetical protein